MTEEEEKIAEAKEFILSSLKRANRPLTEEEIRFLYETYLEIQTHQALMEAFITNKIKVEWSNNDWFFTPNYQTFN